MKINTTNLILRQFTEDDVHEVHQYLSDEHVMKYIEPPYCLEQTKEFIKEYGCKRSMVYAVEEKSTGKVIGHAIFHPYDSIDEYEIGWILDRSCWGKGYATEISKALISYAFEVKHAKRIVAETVRSNQGALAVIKKLGMQENEERSGTLLKLFEYHG